MKKTFDSRLLYWFIGYCTVVLFVGIGAITTSQLTWFHSLRLPVWMPVDDFVATAWLVLFILVAWSFGLFLDRCKDKKRRKEVSLLHILNFFLIFLWNTTFFGFHNLPLSIFVACAIEVVVLILIIRSRVIFNASVLLVPYFTWILFAIFITNTIISLNL